MDRAEITSKTNSRRREKNRRRFSLSRKNPDALKLRLHPTFIAMGIVYCFTGDLLLFLMSCLVALQHECAHAWAAAKLGYRLNTIVLMPFGAMIDGDLNGIFLKDELAVALAGPLCNLLTAGFFAALWWFVPTMYAFTDTAFFSSLSMALVNLLPAYPLDGGRVLHSLITRLFLKKDSREGVAERKARRICKLLSVAFALGLVAAFIVLWVKGTKNFSLLTFAVFLFVGTLGNKDGDAVYAKMDLSCAESMKKGIEIKRVAVLDSCLVKDTFRYIAKGSYLILEVYDGQERHLFDLPQNELSAWFLRAASPYATLRELSQKA